MSRNQPSPWPRRALYVVAGAAWLAIAGLALHFRQQWLDDEKGLPRRALWASKAPTVSQAPAPAPAPRKDIGAACMTSAQYEHLQRLPPYGVVKRAPAAATRDGGR